MGDVSQEARARPLCQIDLPSGATAILVYSLPSPQYTIVNITLGFVFQAKGQSQVAEPSANHSHRTKSNTDSATQLVSARRTPAWGSVLFRRQVPDRRTESIRQSRPACGGCGCGGRDQRTSFGTDPADDRRRCGSWNSQLNKAGSSHWTPPTCSPRSWRKVGLMSSALPMSSEA